MTARGNLKQDNDSLLLWSAMTHSGNGDAAQPNSVRQAALLSNDGVNNARPSPTVISS